jgi:hypothetical protein
MVHCARKNLREAENEPTGKKGNSSKVLLQSRLHLVKQNVKSSKEEATPEKTRSSATSMHA